MRNQHKDDYFSKSKKYLNLLQHPKKLDNEMKNNTPLFNDLLDFLEEDKNNNPYAEVLLQELKLRGRCMICWALTHKEQDPLFVIGWCGEYDDDLVFEEYFRHRMMDHDKPKDRWRNELYSLYCDIKRLCRLEQRNDSFGWYRKELCGRNIMDDCIQIIKKMKEMIDHQPINLDRDYNKLYHAVIRRVNHAFKL